MVCSFVVLCVLGLYCVSGFSGWFLICVWRGRWVCIIALSACALILGDVIPELCLVCDFGYLCGFVVSVCFCWKLAACVGFGG